MGKEFSINHGEKMAGMWQRIFKAICKPSPATQCFYFFISLILLFAVLFSLIQGFKQDSKPINLTFGGSLYFSIVTITTLGYGDITPDASLTKFFAAFEAFLGIIVFGWFLMALAEKRSETTAKDTLGWLTGGDSVPHLTIGAGNFLGHFSGEYPLFDLTVGMQEYWVPLENEELPKNYFYKMRMEYPTIPEMVPFKNKATLEVPVSMKGRVYHSHNHFSFNHQDMLFPETKKFMLEISFAARNGRFQQIVAGRVSDDGAGVEYRSLLIGADGKKISGDDENWKVVTEVTHPKGNTTSLYRYVYNWNTVEMPDWDKASRVFKRMEAHILN